MLRSLDDGGKIGVGGEGEFDFWWIIDGIWLGFLIWDVEFLWYFVGDIDYKMVFYDIIKSKDETFSW